MTRVNSQDSDNHESNESHEYENRTCGRIKLGRLRSSIAVLRFIRVNRVIRGCKNAPVFHVTEGFNWISTAIDQIHLRQQAIPADAQRELHLSYKGTVLKQIYISDFICFEEIIVEIKALKALTDEHRAQVHNYLKSTGHRLGLLINFGRHPNLEYERIVR